MRKHLARVLLASAVLIAGLSASAPAFAQPQDGRNAPPGTALPTDGRTPITTEVPFPTSPGLTPGSTEQKVTDYITAGKVEDLAQYIGIIYNFLISIVGLVAAVAMIIGGFQYLTSAGDSSKIGAAKTRMANAFIGLVLALGAYTILNTINPRLLQLALPDFRKVGTELNFLPWCEEVAAGDPVSQIPAVPVTPVGPGTECGNVGIFKRGETELYCLYYGSCKDKQDLLRDTEGKRSHTCLQRADNSVENVKKAVEVDKKVKLGYCRACGQLTISGLRSLGYKTTQSGCTAWMVQLINWRLKQPNQQFWDYCAVTENQNDFPGCMQVNIDCRAANDNEDAGTSDSRCSDGSSTCGCEGYDDQPNPVFPIKDFPIDQDLRQPGFIRVGDTLDDYQLHTGAVCAWNPCWDYLDPDSGKQSFINGCKSKGGLIAGINSVRSLVNHGDFRHNDCRNR